MNYNGNEILSVEEMCEILKIGKNTAYRLLNDREINAFKIGRLWKIPESSVASYISASVTGRFTEAEK